MSVAALIVAAGRGSRAGQGIPKQYRSLQGRPVLARTLAAFVAHPRIGRTIVVIHPDDRDLYEATLSALPDACIDNSAMRPWRRDEAGFGAQRARGSGRSRPRYRPDSRCRPSLRRPRFDRPRDRGRGALGRSRPGNARDRYDQGDRRDGRRSSSTPDRSTLRAVQTPQAFRFPLLLEAHRRAAAADLHDLHRRWRSDRMGRSAGACVRGRSRQHQAHPSGGFRARPSGA